MICPHHGGEMIPYMGFVYLDKDKQDHFVDVFFKCPDPECPQRRVARYKDEYVFCNMHRDNDLKGYQPDMTNRKGTFGFIYEEEG